MKALARRLPALILAAAILVLPASCDTRRYKLPVEELSIAAGGGAVPVSAELAVKDEERAYGFMERKSIPDGTGMLFVFESDQILSFYMKNTPHPLSIAYIDSRGVIVDIFDMTPYSLSTIQSSRSVRFALEVPQGWFGKNGIAEGDVVARKDGIPLMSFVR